ncbi:MAG TPA: alcohol dehydrogenase catalytic domain-containing protein [Gaiellaceae bacterium]|nr:alcohol dehydrogenase catalytic domain-containing protein [Gaiellaceae bacterium]
MIGLTQLAPAGNVALAKRPEPGAELGQVVVEVVGAGICGTDLHIADGEYETVRRRRGIKFILAPT